MNAVNKKSASLLVFMIYLAGCGPVMYSNTGHNIPLFKEEQTFSGQAAYTSSDGAYGSSGFGLQGAYSVSEKFALMSSFYTMKNPNSSSEYDWRVNGSFFELAGGYYKNSSNKKLVYEGYFGLGTGGIKNKSMDTPGDYVNTRYLKPFFQPNLAFSTTYFDVAISPRIAYLNYTSLDNYHLNSQESRGHIESYYRENNNRVVFEPGIMIRGGFPNAKLELQYSYSTLPDPLSEIVSVNREFFSIGVRFQLAGRTDPESNP